jgi:hypothetical protein
MHAIGMEIVLNLVCCAVGRYAPSSGVSCPEPLANPVSRPAQQVPDPPVHYQPLTIVKRTIHRVFLAIRGNETLRQPRMCVGPETPGNDVPATAAAGDPRVVVVLVLVVDFGTLWGHPCRAQGCMAQAGTYTKECLRYAHVFDREPPQR